MTSATQNLTMPVAPVATGIDALRAMSLAHRIALGFVALTVGSGFLVFSEPAPFDALTLGLMVLLPAIGLFSARPGVVGLGALWMMVAAGLALSAVVAPDTASSVGHSLVTYYLFGASFLFAGFIAKNPVAHGRLVMNAYFVATLFAAFFGIAGYFNLFPGAGDLLTRYGRATGTFKDPNVFGPFLIPGLLMSLHLFLVRPLSRGLLPILAAGMITLALLLSFSRGAWAAAAIGIGIYGVFYLYSAEHDAQRLKVAGLAVMVVGLLAIVLAAALQSEAVSGLLEQRASLSQPYDQGPEGRFGGQSKAINLILENPLGIGSHTFAGHYHHEEAHNIYLSMLMDAGWLGGFAYLLICVATLVGGWLHAMKKTRMQHLFVIAYGALAGVILEGAIIDTHHWRQFYLLLGVVWGLMASDVRILRGARLIGDFAPLPAPPVAECAVAARPARRATFRGEHRAARIVPRSVRGARIAAAPA